MVVGHCNIVFNVGSFLRNGNRFSCYIQFIQFLVSSRVELWSKCPLNITTIQRQVFLITIRPFNFVDPDFCNTEILSLGLPKVPKVILIN